MFKKRKVVVGGLIILAAVLYLGYTSFHGSASYYYTVSEVVSQGSSIYGDSLRINGQVLPDSIERELGSIVSGFTITEGGETLVVIYDGIVPDGFKDGGDVTVEGTLDSSGVLLADNVMVKCASKYEPED